MKKFLAVLVVVALTAFSAVAFADVTMSGSVDIRSRAINELDLNADTQAGTDRYTQERVRLNMDAKVGDAKGKITIETNPDFENWGGVESVNTNMSGLREAWLETPFIGGTVLKAGHQFLQLGNGWFLRNMKYGDDAWLLVIPMGNGHAALADAKITNVANDNDTDFYAGLAVFKVGESTIGVDVSHVVAAKERSMVVTTPVGPQAITGGDVTLNNIGVNAALVVGPVNLKAEVDMQMGDRNDVVDPTSGFNTNGKFKGNQIVVQGNLTAGPAAVNFTVARGTGDTYNTVTGRATSADVETIQTFLDIDPHVAVIYEYLIGQNIGANCSPNAVGKSRGFANTTAVSAGADFKVASNVTVGANLWYLMATEKISQDTTNIRLAASDDLGMEIDAKVNWKLNDAVSWNWVVGYFMPGSAYDYTKTVLGIPTVVSADEATAIQGVLSMSFK